MVSCTQFLRKFLIGFFYLVKQLASQGMFLIRSELPITAYLFLAFYGSTDLTVTIDSQKYRDPSVQVEISESS
jgi:hypothetical protein